MEKYNRKKDLGITDNKKIEINKIDKFKIHDFRNFNEQEFCLGKNMTVLFGENGTSKSTLMGLAVHPFNVTFANSPKNNYSLNEFPIINDIFGSPMETKLNKVFKLSSKTDKHKGYNYDIYLNVNDNTLLYEPITISYYLDKQKNNKQKNKGRFRIVPSGKNQGDGFFYLPSVYTKLDRLYPLVDSTISNNSNVTYSSQEISEISNLYTDLLRNDSYNQLSPFDEKNGSIIHTFGPKNTYYDKDSISSGEDNLGSIINTMISFERVYKKKKNKKSLTGIWAIDEFEASLHPSAQARLFDELMKWSNNYNVQIIINTHSLYLIQHVLSKQEFIDKGYLVVNGLLKQFQKDNDIAISKNPKFPTAYRELTLHKFEDNSRNLLNYVNNIFILCEDETAEHFIKRILTSTRKNKIRYEILKNISYEHSVNNKKGTPYPMLLKLAKNYMGYLEKTNGIIIFDGDVDSSKINSNNVFTLPSLYHTFLEAELMGWILSLDGNDPFFKELDKSKEEFKDDFRTTGHNLPVSIDDFKKKINAINNQNKNNVPSSSDYKKWYTSLQRNMQNKIITRYIKANKDMFSNFSDKVFNTVSIIFKNNNIQINN